MAAATQKSQEQEYFKKLLGKPDAKINKVENYLKLTETAYQQKIKSGTFHIKQTSDIIEQKKNINLSKIDAQNMRFMKKSLQKNLKLIDSRIQQLTEPDKKSTSINDQERLKFVSQMTKARKELEKKREKKLQEQSEKEQQIASKQLQEIKKKEEETRLKRKQQIMKRAQSLQTVRKNKKIQIENQNKQLKSKMEQKILSDRLAQKFKAHQDNILEERKKKLAEIRSIHKPLTKSQFELHLQKIDKLKSQRSRVVDKSDISRYISNDSNKFYKSRWYDKTKKEHKTYEDEKHEDELEQLKQMKDKLKKYSEYVRQNFKPQIDTKKAKQLSEKNQSGVQGPKTQDLRQLGLKYLQYSKQHINPNKKGSQNQQDSNQGSKKVIKPINYLQQIKKNSKGAKKPQEFVQELKKRKNMPEAQKAQKILEYVQGLQRKAKMREQKGKLNNVMVDEELDNMYMEAIEMKLSMLGRDQQEE